VTGSAFDELVATRKAGWLASAASLCRVLDPPAGDETIHVLDAATLAEEARRNALAWTAPGLDRVLRDRLRDRRRGPVLVIDAERIVRSRLEPAGCDEHEVAVLGRLEVAQVAIHELGHARLSEADRETLPAAATLQLVLSAVGQPTSDEVSRRKHGPAWVRSYLVLSSRAARSLWPRQWWIEAAAADVRRYVEVEVGEILAALQPELDTDEPLVNVLRRPPPAAFLSLFNRKVSS
jgi:hypothetical protein